MWFKRPSRPSPSATSAAPLALRPWGNAAHLSPQHLPLCIEGNAGVVQRAARHLLADAQAQGVALFLQEGPRSLVGTWEHLPVPRRHVLPPVHAGTTRETIAQTLLEVTDWLEDTRGEQPQGGWPALLLCSHLGARRDTLLEVVESLNQDTGARLGVVYLQATRHPPLEKPEFTSQLYCFSDGRAVLRRNHDHQRVSLEQPGAAAETPAPARVLAHKSLV